KAISIEPMNFVYLANYADLLRVMNRPQYAADYYQKALQLNPSHAITNHNYAYLLHMYLKQYAKACQYYQMCLELNATDVMVATNYALCLKELKEYDQAIAILKNFSKDDPMVQSLMSELINAKVKTMERSIVKNDNAGSSSDNIANRTQRVASIPDLPEEPSSSSSSFVGGGGGGSSYPNNVTMVTISSPTFKANPMNQGSMNQGSMYPTSSSLSSSSSSSSSPSPSPLTNSMTTATLSRQKMNHSNAVPNMAMVRDRDRDRDNNNPVAMNPNVAFSQPMSQSPHFRYAPDPRSS
ncbi:hypothetical protein RFI_06120, partial [Reticulomyxa filosa]